MLICTKKIWQNTCSVHKFAILIMKSEKEMFLQTFL